MHLFWLFQKLVGPGPSRSPYTRNISSNNGAFIFRPFSFCCGLASLFESPLCRPLSVHLALYVCPLTFSLLSAKRPPFFPSSGFTGHTRQHHKTLGKESLLRKYQAQNGKLGPPSQNECLIYIVCWAC